MNSTYLTRVDAEKNMARYYHSEVLPTLFGDWILHREWGRIGQGGQKRRDWFDSEDQALTAQDKIMAKKRRKGYEGH